MGTQSSNAYEPKTVLVPWNPTDEAHFQRMYDQRVACGWRHDEVKTWKDKVLAGKKFLYWVVLADGFKERNESVEKHLRRYPNESGELHDTAESIFNTPREATYMPFLPVGHIALELFPDRNESLGLPSSTIWIMSLYISWALQGTGLGRSAMLETERLATLPPFNRSVVALDTVQSDFQLAGTDFGKMPRSESQSESQPESQRAGDAGHVSQSTVAETKTKMTTEEWYRRQGYAVVGTETGGYHWTNPKTGEIIPVTIVFMMKSIL
ncbi:hypothetical protein L228DRAFT_269856 [Xylona heveae TC161]|uniref:Uncharacterized protein n=1 Tax=Xylona heveae (strain CBS 132557 / TC161) TaxID=1328760 RepID=A0A165AIT4_XYLHT|nr:hypothetical protein L228DRAFT_269856 [Xylona heveae TC161]KZF20552.1 hypothetical protein L228DRAFT_269856 [Xylona heveae TC161]